MSRYATTLMMLVVLAQTAAAQLSDTEYTLGRLDTEVGVAAGGGALTRQQVIDVVQQVYNDLALAGFGCPEPLAQPDAVLPTLIETYAPGEDINGPFDVDGCPISPSSPLAPPPPIYDGLNPICVEFNANGDCIKWLIQCDGDCPCTCTCPQGEQCDALGDFECVSEGGWTCECAVISAGQCLAYIVTVGPNGELPWGYWDPVLPGGYPSPAGSGWFSAPGGGGPGSGGWGGNGGPGGGGAGGNGGGAGGGGGGPSTTGSGTRWNDALFELNTNSTNQMTCNPTLVSDGVKTETDADLVVTLPGQDFVFSRTYNAGYLLTKPDFPWMIGKGWGTTADGWVDFEAESLQPGDPIHPLPDNLTVVNFPIEYSSQYFAEEAGGSTFYPMGPGDSIVTEDQIAYLNQHVVPVWTLAASGKGQTSYFRTSGGAFVDYHQRIAQRRDAFGNQWNYVHDTIETPEEPRVVAIFLHGTSEYNSRAWVEFEWDADDARLREATVHRRINGQEVITQAVEYTYADDEGVGAALDPDPDASADNLVLVKKSVLLNPPAPGIGNVPSPAEHFVTIEQFRYADGEGGRLTHTFRAEQVEWFAEQAGYTSAAAAGAHLLNIETSSNIDATTGAASPSLSALGLTVDDLASKIIDYYDDSETAHGFSSLEGMVKSETIQAGCACGGGSGQSKLIEFDYARRQIWLEPFEMTPSVTAYPSRWSSVTKITESEIVGGSATAYKELYHWSEEMVMYEAAKAIGAATVYTSIEVPFVVADAIAMPGTTSDAWWFSYHKFGDPNTTHINAPNAHLRAARFHASAIDSGSVGLIWRNGADGLLPLLNVGTQDPPDASGGSDGPWDLVPENAFATALKASEGLVERWTYQENNALVTGESVAKGTSGAQILVRANSYVPASPTPGSKARVDLLQSTTVYRTEGANEVTAFAYATQNVPGSVYQRVVGVKTIHAAEAVAENGPAGVSSYSSLELFNTHGLLVAAVAPDRSITVWDHDNATGVVTGQKRNVDSSELPANPILGGESWQSWGRTADAPTLISATVVDGAGRPLRTYDESGVSLGFQYSMEPYEYFDNGSLQVSGLEYLTQTTIPDEYQTGQYTGPVLREWVNASLSVLRSSTYLPQQITPIADVPPIYGFYTLGYATVDSLANEVGRTIHTYGLSGLPEESRTWHDVPSLGSHYVQTFKHDGLGRLIETTDAIGNMIQTDYDAFHRPVEVRSGRIGALAVQTRHYYDHVSVPGTMSGTGGDGNPTLTRTYIAGPTQSFRDTATIFDWRNRPRLSFTVGGGGAVGGPFPVDVLDLDGRPIRSGTVGSGDMASLVTKLRTDTLTNIPGLSLSIGSYSKIHYSQRGLVYRVESALDPDSGFTEFTQSDTWYDANGRVVAMSTPGGGVTKTGYDGLGRASNILITDGSHTKAFPEDYAAIVETDPFNNSDVVLQWNRTTFGATPGLPYASLPLLAETHRRSHAATGTGIGLNPISTFNATVYDDAARPIAAVSYGANTVSTSHLAGGGAPTSPTSIPPSSATALVIETRYDALGRAFESLDPLGRVTRTFFDDLDRPIVVIDNAVGTLLPEWDDAPGHDIWDLSPRPSNPDENRATSFVYDGAGNVVKQTAHLTTSALPTSKRQTTEFIYSSPDAQVSVNAHLGNTAAVNGLIYEVHYPDESTGLPSLALEDTVQFAYNRAGERLAVLDQNATLREYTLDSAGRVEGETASLRTDIKGVTVPLGGIDFSAVNELDTDFDDLGRVIAQSSKHNSILRNQLTTKYDELSRAEEVWFNQVGEVTQGGASVYDDYVGYAYEDLGFDGQAQASDPHNHSRLLSMSYPTQSASRTVVTLDYGPDRATGDLISRPESILWPTDNAGSGSHHDLAYTYLGLGGDVRSHITATNDTSGLGLVRDRIVEASTGDDTAGTYYGLDNFGRVKRDAWTRGVQVAPNPPNTPSAKPALYDHSYHYDLNSNITSNTDERPGAHTLRDEEYEYDDLDRITKSARGALASHLEGSQQWVLDLMGNWTQFDTDADGDGDFDAADDNETRDFNGTNEVSASTQDTASREFIYDPAGNLVAQQLSGDTRRVLAYDPWNRLVRVSFEGTTDGGQTWINLQTRAAYTYFAGNQRATSVVDTDLDGVADKRTHYYYDAKWQLLEERVDEGYAGAWDWGGTSFAVDFDTSDDVIRQYVWCHHSLDRLAGYLFGTTAGADTVPWNYAALTDRTRSVIGMQRVREGAPTDRVRYTPYGEPELLATGDADGDGNVTNDDRAFVNGSIGAVIGDAHYTAEADLDCDGDIDLDDVQIVIDNQLGPGAQPGAISSLDCSIGFAGAVYDEATGMVLMRNRWYDPKLGRFITRDPAGYVDGMSLYWYAGGNPVMLVDPTGLAKTWLGGSVDAIGGYVGMKVNSSVFGGTSQASVVATAASSVIPAAIDNGADAVRDVLPVASQKSAGLQAVDHVIESAERTEQRYQKSIELGIRDGSSPIADRVMLGVQEATGATKIAEGMAKYDASQDRNLTDGEAGLKLLEGGVQMGATAVTLAAPVLPAGGGMVNLADDVVGVGGDTVATSARAVDNVPVFRVNAARDPDLAMNIYHAQQAGHPRVLTRGGPGTRTANRAVSLSADIPTSSSVWRDEYPFASTIEGGRGAWIGHVPEAQQRRQAGHITGFYSKYNIRPGDRFRVEPYYSLGSCYAR